MKSKIKIGNFTIQADDTFFFIAGPCVIEDEATTLEVACFVKQLSDELSIPAIFKTSYDKANRTSLESFRGPGIEEGLEIIRKVKDQTGLPVLSDVHGINELERAAKVLDVIQIPAFLCRQTDLIVAAAKCGIPVNIKKGQFISPGEMGPVIGKVTSNGNRNILDYGKGQVLSVIIISWWT